MGESSRAGDVLMGWVSGCVYEAGGGWRDGNGGQELGVCFFREKAYGEGGLSSKGSGMYISRLTHMAWGCR